MIFKVLAPGSFVPEVANTCFLVRNNWDDYGFKTQFRLRYRDRDENVHSIGEVKIAKLGMSSGLTPLPDEFDQLNDDYFSLGQDDSYYESLNGLAHHVRDDILRALRDIAFNLDLFDDVLEEEVTGNSLLRFVSTFTVANQFHRMTLGGSRLSEYSFNYIYPRLDNVADRNPLQLSFVVSPGARPPSNVHVIIGRNGVGKSRLLNNITKILVSDDPDPDAGSIEFDPAENGRTTKGRHGARFANVVSVAFSAFDDFQPASNSRNRSENLLYKYIGLKKIHPADGRPKDISILSQEFGNSVSACLRQDRVSRWRDALEMLESDPIFADSRVADVADSYPDETLKENARILFSSLSSGHKIVLLTITRLVETIEERSLVLLDEPESHLHPPLLSAFIRALSNLLIDRNGVAIIATHSPVVLQEVPKSCVWRLRRSGFDVAADRPELETFGENVGTLTNEIFGLEVTRSGFHKILADEVEAGRRSYREILDSFDGNLGSEAKALIRSLLATQAEE